MNPQPSTLTPAQQRAVAARKNVLVMAGAGTGKTKTLIERCLACLEHDGAELDELLVVTFTDAAAAEMRLRLRRELEARAAGSPDDPRWARQLARFEVAHLGTLHRFCFQLVREHFHELGLDPRLSILEDSAARELAETVLDAVLEPYYDGTDAPAQAVQDLIRQQGGRADRIRELIRRVHDYAQTRPDAAGWLTDQAARFEAPAPPDWAGWLRDGITAWRDDWLPVLQLVPAENQNAHQLVHLLGEYSGDLPLPRAVELLSQAVRIGTDFPTGKKGKWGKPLEKFVEEAKFLASVVPSDGSPDPLAQDWQWVRGHLAALLRLVREFAARLAARKQAEGVLDYHDLEQFALRLLWDDHGQPTAVARHWRARLRFVFVDEYQDINAAQDRIIAGLARPDAEANRFLVGDVKQSIYRFRLAEPAIFRGYAEAWGKAGEPHAQVVHLSENFRSRAGVLEFVNRLFTTVMCPEVGGVGYAEPEKLRFGAPEARVALGLVPGQPRVELCLRRPLKESAAEEAADANDQAPDRRSAADYDETSREARLVARRVRALLAAGHEIWDESAHGLRAARAGDVAILLRSPKGKAEAYARAFAETGLPLTVARGGFFDCAEVLDLLNLLQLLDNPLQDLPCLAVLRSPFAGFTLEELGRIRLAAKGMPFWTALNRAAKTEENPPTRAKIRDLLDRWERWRKRARQQPLAECLADILQESAYLEWWRAQPQGAQAAANVGQFLQLAEQFDRRQRQGLARFLAHLEARREVELDSAPPPTESGTVRLMSIHQSKGLEFPMVILPDLAKGFNEMDLREDLIFDEHFGLCPLVKPPFTARRYPSLPFWLARRRQRRELRGEELRLLYVALTRARDSLVLVATVPQKQWSSRWTTPAPVTPHAVAEAKSYADWLGMWFASRPDAAAAQPLASAVWPELAWRWVNDDETFAAATPDPAATSAAAAPDRPGLPEDPLSEADYRRLTGWLEWNYPFAAATRQKAKVSVTELRKAAELAEATEAAPLWPRRLERRPAGKRRGSQLSAAQAGLAHHQFMQRADLGAPLDTAAGVRAEADRLAREGYLTPEERQGLDLAALADFWRSPFGCELREHAASVRRELPFMARFTPAEVAAATGRPAEPGLAGEFLVVQGAADLVVLLAGEIWLVDFKTDAVGPAGPAEKVKTYTPQVRLYAAALEKIFHRPVTRAVLHFLSCGETVSAVSRQDGPPAAGALFGETVPGKLVTGAARP